MFRVDDILEGQKGDQGGGPKMAKIQYGVKLDTFKYAFLLFLILFLFFEKKKSFQIHFCILVIYVMFLDFGQQKTFCFPKRKHFVSRKKLLHPKESFTHPKKSFLFPKMSTTFSEHCIPNKAFCTPKKVAPEVFGEHSENRFIRVFVPEPFRMPPR